MSSLPQIREPDLPDIEPPELPEIRKPDLPHVEKSPAGDFLPPRSKAKGAPQTVASFVKSRGLADDERMKSAATEVASLVREAGGDEEDVTSTLVEWWGGADLAAKLKELGERPGGLTPAERETFELEVVDLIRSPGCGTKREVPRRERKQELLRILGVDNE